MYRLSVTRRGREAQVRQIASHAEQGVDFFLARERLATPRGRVIAPLDQLPAGVLQLFEGRRIVPGIAPGEPREGSPQARRLLGQPPLQPRAKRPLIEPRRSPARSVPRKPDRRAPPPAVRAGSARRRNGWCRWRLLPDVPGRLPSVGCRPPSAAALSSSSRSRSFISPAALCVNVTAAILSMVVRPGRQHATMRSTSSVVLPVPAEASTIRLSSSESRIRARASASETCARTCSCHPPDFDQRLQPLIAPVFLAEPLFFVGTAHDAVVADLAGVFSGAGGRNPPAIDASISPSSFCKNCAGAIVELDLDGCSRRAAWRRTGGPLPPALPELLRGEPVQKWLQAPPPPT